MRRDNEHPQREKRTRVVVRWGCDQHRTPADQDCQWCLQQGELFPRTAVTHHPRRTR